MNHHAFSTTAATHQEKRKRKLPRPFRLLNAMKIAPNHKHPKKMPGSKNYIKLSMGDSEMMRNGNLQK